jgi:hypothetical protein
MSQVRTHTPEDIQAITRKWKSLQERDLNFLQLTSEVKNISKDRYNLIAKQVEAYLRERNT